MVLAQTHENPRVEVSHALEAREPNAHRSLSCSCQVNLKASLARSLGLEVSGFAGRVIQWKRHSATCLMSHGNEARISMPQAAANKALCSLSKASTSAARAVLDTGLLHCIQQQLIATPGDAAVKESALVTLASLARQSPELAAAVAQPDVLSATAGLLATSATGGDAAGC
jgi:hypothetical protein